MRDRTTLLRCIAGALAIGTLLAAGCFNTRASLSSKQQAEAAEIAQECAPDIAAAISGAVGSGYSVSATVLYASPDTLSRSVSQVAADYLVSIAPDSQPEKSLSARLRATVVRERDGAFRPVDVDLDFFEAVGALPVQQRTPLIAFLAQASIPASTPGLSLYPLDATWRDPSGDEMPAKQQLLKIAKKRGYDPRDCQWLTYVGRKELISELLAFDRDSGSWVLLARRRGRISSPVEEVQ